MLRKKKKKEKNLQNIWFCFKRRGSTAKSALCLVRTFVKGYLLETIGFVNLDPDRSGEKNVARNSLKLLMLRPI